MRRTNFYCIAAVLALGAAAHASTFRFDTDPFAGTPVLNAPGRQVVGGELFINFSPATDVFSFDPAVFGVGNPVNFVNGQASGLPNTANAVVLETFDNDNNLLTPFGAPQAADLIAAHVTTPGPGFFIYFNQSLNLARLVYSTDLSSSSSDLKILARMLNFFGDEGKNLMPTITARNFEFTASEGSAVPEPANFNLIAGVGLISASALMIRRRRARV